MWLNGILKELLSRLSVFSGSCTPSLFSSFSLTSASLATLSCRRVGSRFKVPSGRPDYMYTQQQWDASPIHITFAHGRVPEDLRALRFTRPRLIQ